MFIILITVFFHQNKNYSDIYATISQKTAKIKQKRMKLEFLEVNFSQIVITI